jgi:hypothetical protein
MKEERRTPEGTPRKNTLTYYGYYKYRTKEYPHTSQSERRFIRGMGTSISGALIDHTTCVVEYKVQGKGL